MVDEIFQSSILMKQCFMSDLCGACPVTWLLQLTHTSDHWLCWRYFQELSSFSTIKVIITAWHDILDWTIHHYVKFSTESVSQSSNYWLIRQFHKIFSVNLLAMNCKGRLYLLEGGGGNQINTYLYLVHLPPPPVTTKETILYALQ